MDPTKNETGIREEKKVDGVEPEMRLVTLQEEPWLGKDQVRVVAPVEFIDAKGAKITYYRSEDFSVDGLMYEKNKLLTKLDEINKMLDVAGVI